MTQVVAGRGLEERFTADEGTAYLTGIQALVRMIRDRAVLDRCRGLVTSSFVSGYEGSPLSGYDLEIARRMPLLADYDVVHRPGLNEEIAATSVMGSQVALEVGTPVTEGVVGYWYGKAPGLDRASDALRHANLIGSHPNGGAVALVGDDAGAKSSTVPSSSELALADLSMPTLVPADPQDILDLGVHAALLSRLSGLWCALRIGTSVADASGTADVGPWRLRPALDAVAVLGESGHRPTAAVFGAPLFAMERSLHEVRLPRALDYARLAGLNRITHRADGDRIGIISAGRPWLDVREALRRIGIHDDELAARGVRLLRLGMVWPLDPGIVADFAEGLDEIVVVEEKRAFVETAVRDVLYGTGHTPRVVGKRSPDGTPLLSPLLDLDVDSIATALAQRLSTHGIRVNEPVRSPIRTSLPIAPRTPYFCSGCPHSSSTKVADGTLVGGGIGCHAMVLFMDPKQVGTVTGLTQMGGEGAQWLGMAPFVAEHHIVQNVGDGTFAHSGSLALRAAVAAGHGITYKLLLNGTVAMTGGQDPVGQMGLAQVCRLLLAEGVAQVVVTTDDVPTARAAGLPAGVEVRPRDDLVAVQEELARVPGVTVLVHDQHCAAEKRRGRKRGTVTTPTRRVVINERICEGCGDCGEKSNCLSVHPVQTDYGRKTRIHQSSCNLDYSCLKGDCPSFVTVVPREQVERPRVPDLADGDLPDPARLAGTSDGFSLRITGIGGTGVVTVSQVLATAAVLEGKHARALDQTGAAQKGGAVVGDVRITDEPTEWSPKVPEGACDLYLACDGLVASDPKHLVAASADRTTAVVSTTEIPTGFMVVDTSRSYPAAAVIRSTLDARVRRGIHLDPGRLATLCFGSAQSSTMVMVGVAHQSGALPLQADSVESAIRLNGVAAVENIQAFRRGRQLIADPGALWAAIAAAHPGIPEVLAEALSERPAEGSGSLARTLDELVAARRAELVRHSDRRHADLYAGFVAEVRAAEDTAVTGSTRLATAVAEGLFALMAYKDEYEVARLATDPGFAAQLRDRFGEGARATVHLHPPMLRALGLDRTLPFGPATMPALRALARLKSLRGTAMDPFGRAPVRVVERELVRDYHDTIAGLLPRLRAGSLDAAVVVAELPDLVRGYEEVKLRSIERYREAMAGALATFEVATVETA